MISPYLFSSSPKSLLPLLRRPISAAAAAAPPTTSAYVHLPFCRRRCHYCDFPIIALGAAAPPSDPRISAYVSLLLREIAAVAAAAPPAAPPLQTVFFGGGTPSLVPAHLLSALVSALSSSFGLAPDPEISIEMDPGTFDEPALRATLAAGANRVSLGVQAFQDDLLRLCGRAHSAADVRRAIAAVSAAVPNWSLDLISSLPHQTAAAWRRSVELAAAAAPAHVSVYDLQIEKGTKFARLYTPGELPLPSEDLSADMYRTAAEILSSAGYSHYEISSYTKPGFACRHNLGYWGNQPFYGFGLGAASFVGGVRFTRPRRMKEYEEFVAALEGGAVVFPAAEGGVREVAMDVVMLALRTAGGVDVAALAAEFGEGIGAAVGGALMDYVDSGLVGGRDFDGKEIPAAALQGRAAAGEVRFLRLSDPEGFLLSNEIIASVFAAIP
ncbi:radical SAM superfamily protein [Wolffia australiana]